MASFFFPLLNATLQIDGASLMMGDRTVFTDAAAILAVTVLDDGIVVLGGESKRIIGIQVTQEGTKELYSLESPRKLFSLHRLSASEVMVVDSAGGVRSLEWRDGSKIQDIFGHFAPVTAALILPEFIVTADVDTQVRVARKTAPREVIAYFLGNPSPVLALYRGRDDNEVVCITRERTVKYFQIVPEPVEVDPFINHLVPEMMHKSKKEKREERVV